MIKISQAAYELLQLYCRTVADEFTRQWNSGSFVGGICPKYVTHRPEQALLPLISEGKYYWEPQISEINIPCPAWYGIFEGNPILQQIAEELAKTLPTAENETDELFLDDALDQLKGYIFHTVVQYLAFSLDQHPDNYSNALQLALSKLDVQLDPATTESCHGCYLYNFELEDAAGPLSLADDIEIRLSTFEDVVRQANSREVDGEFLPPPFLLVQRLTARSLVSAVLRPVNGYSPDSVSILNTVIAVLRLYQPPYIGRGSAFVWCNGIQTSFMRIAPATDATAHMFIRGDDPPHVPQWNKYILKNENVAEIRETLSLVRKLVHIDNDVNDTIRFLAQNEPDWSVLYKIYEIVRDGVGGERQLVSNGWLTQKARSRFTNTANNFEAAGDKARHARLSTAPPSVPMDMIEAGRLIGDLVLEWFKTKEPLIEQHRITEERERFALEDIQKAWLLQPNVIASVNSLRFPDDLIILVRHEGKYGAFKATEQRHTDSRNFIKYEWWYQPDDAMNFTEGADSGSGEAWESDPLNPPLIKIGPINLSWSICGNNLGYAYFRSSSIPPDKFDLCATDKTHIELIDISDFVDKFHEAPTNYQITLREGDKEEIDLLINILKKTENFAEVSTAFDLSSGVTIINLYLTNSASLEAIKSTLEELYFSDFGIVVT